MSTPNPMPSASEEHDLHRQLIQQFYENSLVHYGPESEQTILFAEHLASYPAAQDS